MTNLMNHDIENFAEDVISRKYRRDFSSPLYV